MNQLEKIYQLALNATYEEKLYVAKEKTGIIMNFLKKYVDSEVMLNTYILLISAYVGADGNVSRNEYKFISDLLDVSMDYDGFVHFVKSSYDDKFIEMIDKIIDESPTDIKIAFCALGVNICACDGVITPSEKRLLEKFIA